MLIGLDTLAIPGVGPIIVAGEAASTIASTLAGAEIGAAAGGIIGALVGLGIPEEKAKIYNARVKSGSYLLLANGTDEEIHRAEIILRDNGIEEFGIYDAPDLGNAETIATNPVARQRTVVPTKDVDEIVIEDEQRRIR
ncbi:hypothetical protein [Myxosarcina sp. GI1(2024)]